MKAVVVFTILILCIVFMYRQKTLTIVSAYYDIPSKRPSSDYHERLKRFLGKVNCNMVFYTSADLLEKLKEYRGKYNDKTKFYVVEKDDLQSIKKYGLDFWKEQYEDKIHENKPYLGAIWNNKKEFVVDAISKNDFNSTHYAWIDAGIIDRDTNVEIININHTLLGDKVVMYSVNDIPQDETIFFNYLMPDYIAGDTYLGPKEKLLKYKEHFDTITEKYLQNGKSVYSDQNVMTTLAKSYQVEYDVIKTDFKWRQLFRMLVGEY